MVSTRANQTTPFLVMDVLERAREMEREGIDVIHLEVGEPDFDTPPCIKEACLQAMQDGKTHYTASLGLVHDLHDHERSYVKSPSRNHR